MISLRNVSIGYQANRVLLKGINLEAGRGEMIALAGRNGSGKSTLLRSMLGLIPLLEGKCLLENVPVLSLDSRARARSLSYVSSQLGPGSPVSVRELVSLGRLPHTGWYGRPAEKDHEHVINALREVGLEKHMDRNIDRLSDGERQRVMIARAVAQDTPVMILDEPAAYLDIPNKYELVRILSTYRDRGKTIIYSTHDLETAMICADKFWVIEKENVLQGSPEDLGILGVFDRLFSASGIRFDLESGKFRFKTSSRGSLILEGDSEETLFWTRHALERTGYAVMVDGDESDTRVKISRTGSAYSWTVQAAGTEKNLSTLYELARFLKKEI